MKCRALTVRGIERNANVESQLCDCASPVGRVVRSRVAGSQLIVACVACNATLTAWPMQCVKDPKVLRRPQCEQLRRWAIFGDALAGYHAESEYGESLDTFRTVAQAQRRLDNHLAAVLAICNCTE